MSALELFSQCARFLHLFGAQIDYAPREFSLLFSVRRGERCFTRAVQRVGHHRVYLTDSVSRSRMKKFDGAHCHFGQGVGRVLGWNDPTFWRTVRPTSVSGVVPAQHAGLKEARLHTFTT